MRIVEFRTACNISAALPSTETDAQAKSDARNAEVVDLLCLQSTAQLLEEAGTT